MPSPRKRKTLAPPPPRRPPSRLDFCSPGDSAWYDVRVALQGGALRVMYEGFREEQDEWYDPAADLPSPRAVDALRARFRAPCPPLEDAGCRDLLPGAPLCVVCALANDELKYYDAVLEAVSPAAHETVDGEEKCACRFFVRWVEGPRAGARAEVGVDAICRVLQPSPVQDPVLVEFLDGVMKSLGNGEGSAASSPAVGGTGGGSAPGQAHLK